MFETQARQQVAVQELAVLPQLGPEAALQQLVERLVWEVVFAFSFF